MDPSVQVTVEGMPPGRLLLYPHILLACLAALTTTYVQLYALMLDLLSMVMSCVIIGLPYHSWVAGHATAGWAVGVTVKRPSKSQKQCYLCQNILFQLKSI
jgi:hypothetical protein